MGDAWVSLKDLSLGNSHLVTRGGGGRMKRRGSTSLSVHMHEFLTRKKGRGRKTTQKGKPWDLLFVKEGKKK